ncbi:MAG: hypothetical protein Q9187_008640 [Circinaria calcarea]
MSQATCELTPQARAFSTILTAFVGSVITGATSGALVAFLNGWISWLAVLRVLIGAFFSLYQAFSSSYTRLEQDSTPLHTDQVELQQQRSISHGSQGVAHGEPQDATKARLPKIQRFQLGLLVNFRNSCLIEDVTVLGWIGWLYTAVYSPIVQILWLAENWTAASGPLKLVRGLGISISALSLVTDTKRRYASKLRDMKYGGSPAYVAFNIVNAGSAFGMGIMCAALLIKGAVDTSLAWYGVMIYCVFLLIWTAASFTVLPIQDGGIKGLGIIADVLMGAFAGIFLAAPAFAVMMLAQRPTLTPGGFSTPDSGLKSLQKYLSCDSVAVWQKFVAIFP